METSKVHWMILFIESFFFFSSLMSHLLNKEKQSIKQRLIKMQTSFYVEYFAKLLTNNLYLLKFAIKSFIVELEPKILSVSYGQTDARKEAVKYRNSFPF